MPGAGGYGLGWQGRVSGSAICQGKPLFLSLRFCLSIDLQKARWVVTQGSTMLKRSLYTVLVLIILSVTSAQAEPIMRDDGIHTESWVKNISFLVLKEDLKEALDKGKKGLVIIFEQQGCGSCKRLHEVNFQDKGVVDYITRHFDVLIMNMYGDNEVTDFDGNTMSEARFNEQMRVNFSPTTVFIGSDGKEIFRVPGYLKPYFYQSAYEYVVDGGPGKGLLFPRWLRAKRDRLKAEGKAS